MGGYSSFVQYILDPVLHFGIGDVADIILLAVLVYAVLRFGKDRRSGSIFIGMLLLGAGYILTYVLSMQILNLLFRAVFDCLIILIAILFQEELREALEKIGVFTYRLLRRGGPAGSSAQTEKAAADLISVLTDTACDLSRIKCGALIVIQRQTMLGEYIKTGVTVDALPSCELFANLFFNRSPLHDGAVIVRGGRIAAAGCILPSSKSTDIPQDLGTRHRAAIGLSEQSDAVVLIVSEETGNISIANNGYIKRNYTAGTLRSDLSALLMSGKGMQKGEKQ